MNVKFRARAAAALIAVCAAGSHPSRAEELTLERALGEGHSKSPVIQRAQAASEEIGWKKTEALSGFLPRLSVSAEHFFREKYQIETVPLNGTVFSVPAIFPTSIAAVDVSLPIFDGLRNVNQYRAAGLLSEAAEQDLKWTDFRTTQEIRLRFFQTIAALRLQGVADQNVRTLEDHFNRVKALKHSGIATQYDVLRVEVQLHDAQVEALAATDNAAVSRKRLAETMGLMRDARPVVGDLPQPEASRVRGLDNVDFSHRPDIEALTKKSEAASKAEAAESAYLVPRIAAMGEYAYYNNIDNSLTSAANYQTAYQVGVTLSWNIFDGAASIARSKESMYQRIEAEKSLEISRLHAPTDFDYWRRRYSQSTATYQAKTDDVAKSRESVRLADEGFKSGTRTTSEVLDAELDLFRAQAGVVNSQMNAAEAMINLELAVGRKI